MWFKPLDPHRIVTYHTCPLARTRRLRLVAMATAIIAIIELLSAFNFDMALIQSQQATGTLHTA